MLAFILPNYVAIGAAALAGWCGTVPISVILWYILHRKPIPHPDPEPWWRFSIAGIMCGLITGTAIAGFLQADALISTTILVSLSAGFAGGVVASGFVANALLKSNAKQNANLR